LKRLDALDRRVKMALKELFENFHDCGLWRRFGQP
jgi:hypothetical protein